MRTLRDTSATMVLWSVISTVLFMLLLLSWPYVSGQWRWPSLVLLSISVSGTAFLCLWIHHVITTNSGGILIVAS